MFSESLHKAASLSPEKELDTQHSRDKLRTRHRPVSKPGLSLEKKLEVEKQRRHLLINEHNRLMFEVKKKEAKLTELQDVLKANNLQPADYSSEDTLKQRVRQLENNVDKMKVKIKHAMGIQTVYQGIHERLQEELHDLSRVLDQKERAVIIGQAEVDKATKQLQSAAAAADRKLAEMVQAEHETMEKKREMERELCELSAEERELKEPSETLGRLSLTGLSRLKEPEEEEEEEEEEGEEEAHSIPFKDHRRYNICGASPSDVRRVEDMEALREALGCADLQDLITKVVSQQTTKEQLLTELTQCKELVRQDAKTMADLEVRFDRLQEQLQARLKQEKDRAKGLQAQLKQSQHLLDTVDMGVNNLYFWMSCVPVEGLPTVCGVDSIDKLRDIRARLPTLQQRASEQRPVISELDRERIYSLLEQCNTMEPRNVKRPTTPADMPQLSDDDEETCAPSREEIKRSGSRLIESKQNKKSSRRARRKQ
ncbi:coiled-coil domain-containing protein 183-like [Pempheris klunzingeri]|uniref:coiled-coil domain-containing protein 183-like n=1 Tax=Pempheris klunzingeri TaxID=3127111 RepID=UPI0039803B68